MATSTIGAQTATWLRHFVEPGQVTELRVLHYQGPSDRRPYTMAGFFDAEHLDDMAKAAMHLTKHARGIYWTMNPIDSALLARRANRVGFADSGSLAADKDVLRRRWLLIDADPERVGGVSATDQEKADAHEVILAVRNYLGDLGWPEPIFADSGNGYHLLSRIDLPADDGGLVQRVLQALAKRFDSDKVKIDRSVFNPARICKLPGTWARKGDSVPNRPHRQSAVLEVPEEVQVVEQQYLETVAREVAMPSTNGMQHHRRQPIHDHSENRRRAAAYLSKVPPAVSGHSGHNQTFHAAAVLVEKFGLSVEDSLPLLQVWNQTCQPPWTEQELLHKLRDAEKKVRGLRNGTVPNGAPDEAGAARPTTPSGEVPTSANAKVDLADVHLTDLGNARRVVHDHGKDLRHCHPWRSWLVWDGRRWSEDDTAEAVRRVKDTQKKLYRWAAEKIQELGEEGDEEDEERKAAVARLAALLKHALRWEDTRKIMACLESARSEPGIPILPNQLDANPFLFNVLNGTLDLRTGQLRPHEHTDYLTKLAKVAFDPNAKCPLWERVLDRIIAGNTGLIAYLQRVIGYSLTGDVGEQCLWFLYGAGANGKSTFLGALLAMLGDYGMQAVSDLLLAKSHESHPTERADLFGKRLVATIEVDQGRHIAESLMKQLTGGDAIRARRMRQDFFEFQPTHKILLAANYKPVVRGTDHALWRRIKLVPFTVTIPEEEKDKNLPAKLKAELPGILAWAVRGCQDWQRIGLAEPDEVRKATAEYQAEQDVVAAFLSECCFLHPQAKAGASGLMEAYCRWSGDKNMTTRAFATRLQAKGFENRRGHGGVVLWHGIGLPEMARVNSGE